MFGFGKTEPLDRDAVLRRAEEFRARKKPKKAVAELKRLLANNPRDAGAHAKLGPLLTSLGRPIEALDSYRIAAADYDQRGFFEKAQSLWLQVAEIDVTDLALWKRVSEFHIKRGHPLEGSKLLFRAAGLQTKKHHTVSIQLLTEGLVHEPKNIEATLQLAPLLVKENQRDEAHALLESALTWTTGRWTKRVRKLQFRLFPGFSTLWRWLRA